MQVEFINGELTLKLTAGMEEQVILKAADAYGKAKAEQETLSQIYDVKAAAKRLSVCTLTVLRMLEDGRLRYASVAKKGYRITELAIREFLGDIKK